MVFFNYALRKLNAKIVYYGPGLCGKTTNLEWIHDHFEGGKKGNMLSLATEGDRTIFFDLLPLDIGTIRGMDVTLQLYTVPGQVHYNSTRQLVLRGADGVVFVADSQRAMLGSNLDSWKNLKENLLLQGIELASFPHVIQFNKRDLQDIAPVEQLDSELNEYSAPIFEAIAIQGIGVQETLEGIVKLVMRSLRSRYEAEFARSAAPSVPAGVSSFGAPPAPPVLHPAATRNMEGPPSVAAPPSEPEAPAIQMPSPRDPDAETHPGIAAMSLASPEEAEEKEPTLVIPPEETGLSVDAADVGEVELEDASLETADLEPGETGPVELTIEPDEETAGEVVIDHSPDAAIAESPGTEPEPGEPLSSEAAEPAEWSAAEEEPSPVAPSVEPETAPESAFEGEPELEPAVGPEPEPEPELVTGPVEGSAVEEPRDVLESGPEGGSPAVPAPEAGGWNGPDREEAVELEPEPEPAETAPWDGAGAPSFAASQPVEETGAAEQEPEAAQESPFGPEESGGAVVDVEEPSAPFQPEEPEMVPDHRDEGHPEAELEPEPEPEPVSEPELEEPFAPSGGEERAEAEIVTGGGDEETAPFAETGAESVPVEDVDTGSRGQELELEADEPFVAEEEPIGEETGEPAAPPAPEDVFTVWDGEPFGEVPADGAGAAPPVLAPVEARAVGSSEGGNQLRLQLEGTGALAEYGQVRELDIVVPVPGDWIGGQKVTLQFRLTLVPKAEEEG